jgi:hypothetical protein
VHANKRQYRWSMPMPESHRNALKSAAGSARAEGSHPKAGNDERVDDELIYGDRCAIVEATQSIRVFCLTLTYRNWISIPS